MIRKLAYVLTIAATLFTISCASGPGGNRGIRSNADVRKIEAQSRDSLNRLYAKNPLAKEMGSKAQGILVFPEITKGGFVVGGAWGDGALYKRGQSAGYYRSISASWGLEAGLQKYGYALFLMDENAINRLNRSGGWELGSEPNLTVIDQGVAGSLSTTTYDNGSVAFFFDQRGLMGGISVQGTKITRLAVQP